MQFSNKCYYKVLTKGIHRIGYYRFIFDKQLWSDFGSCLLYPFRCTVNTAALPREFHCIQSKCSLLFLCYSLTDNRLKRISFVSHNNNEIHNLYVAGIRFSTFLCVFQDINYTIIQRKKLDLLGSING